MSGSIAEVVSQLLAVIKGLDRAAVTAMRAQVDAEQALKHYIAVSKDSDSPKIDRVKHEARVAADKAGKVARLLAKASYDFARLVDIIALDATSPMDSAAADGLPSGERLSSPARSGGSLDDRLLTRVAGTRSADDGIEGGRKGLNALIKAVRVKDPGSVTAPPSPASPAIRNASGREPASAGDAAVAAFVLTLVGIKGKDIVVKNWRKYISKNSADSGGKEVHDD